MRPPDAPPPGHEDRANGQTAGHGVSRDSTPVTRQWPAHNPARCATCRHSAELLLADVLLSECPVCAVTDVPKQHYRSSPVVRDAVRLAGPHEEL